MKDALLKGVSNEFTRGLLIPPQNSRTGRLCSMRKPKPKMQNQLSWKSPLMVVFSSFEGPHSRFQSSLKKQAICMNSDSYTYIYLFYTSICIVVYRMVQVLVVKTTKDLLQGQGLTRQRKSEHFHTANPSHEHLGCVVWRGEGGGGWGVGVGGGGARI